MTTFGDGHTVKGPFAHHEGEAVEYFYNGNPCAAFYFPHKGAAQVRCGAGWGADHKDVLAAAGRAWCADDFAGFLRRKFGMGE